MLQSQPSKTALRVALRRAAHQIFDPPPLVLVDPIAVPILGREYAEDLRKTATRLHKPFSAALRAFLVARSRYAEDTLAAAVSQGVTQYVLLGAGLDTFAYRNPHPTLRVFEVDHPSTQLWKRDLLKKNTIAIPPSLTFTPVNFENQSLPNQLRLTGFNPAIPTVFAWLGVVPYLTLPAFRSTVRYLAEQPTRSAVILDYAQPRDTLSPLEQLAHDSIAERVALAGEPFLLYFTPEDIATELAAFNRIEDLGSPEINARYFPPRELPMPGPLQTRGTAGRLLSAHR
jgi:methyltransferase (TIGR00027 family)